MNCDIYFVSCWGYTGKIVTSVQFEKVQNLRISEARERKETREARIKEESCAFPFSRDNCFEEVSFISADIFSF